MKGAPLTVTEARVILRADEALDLTYEARLAAGTTFSDEEREAWTALVESAKSLLGALVDLGRMFDARDHLLTTETKVAPIPRTPRAYKHALDAGHYVGVLPLGSVRVAQVYIGISPFAQKMEEKS